MEAFTNDRNLTDWIDAAIGGESSFDAIPVSQSAAVPDFGGYFRVAGRPRSISVLPMDLVDTENP
jgi:hypothetical protein